jgi:hypothetical protein
MAGENDGGREKRAAITQFGGVVIGAAETGEPVQAEGFEPVAETV